MERKWKLDYIGLTLIGKCKEMETLGLGLGLYWDHEKENGNYYIILGLHWDNGKRKWKLRV